MSRRSNLNTDQKMSALAMIARGDTLSQVAGQLLEQYRLEVSEAALSKMKHVHMKTILKMQETMADAKAADAEIVLKRSRMLIHRRLDKAERDERALEELDLKYRDGKIPNRDEYRRRKAGLIKVSVAELTNISNSMHRQTVRPTSAPALLSGEASALPASTSQQTPAQLEALLHAIKSGNTVEMTRLVFNPGVPSNEPAQPIPAQS